MNTTARIEEVCRAVHEPLLISKPLMDVVVLPRGLAAVSIGIRALRGKEASLELFAIRRADSSGAAAADPASSGAGVG